MFCYYLKNLYVTYYYLMCYFWYFAGPVASSSRVVPAVAMMNLNSKDSLKGISESFVLNQNSFYNKIVKLN